MLTREQVLNTSGFDLDVMVAVHIFNEPVHPLSGSFMIREGKSYYFIPRYSDETSASWQVLDWLVDKYEDATLSYPWNVSADYDPMRETTWKIHAEGKSAPEAICKAALLAVLDI
jgi:hypothetical protein